jgi:dynein heavy chain
MADVHARVTHKLQETAQIGHPFAAPNLVLFEEMLANLLKVTRILAAPRGCALLLGASGKRTVAQLAAMVLQYALVAPRMSGSYSTADFLEEMKGVFRTVVLKKQQVVLLFSDHELRNDVFLDYLNTFLLSGEVPGLLTKDESELLLTEIIYELNKKAAAQGASEPPTLAKHFVMAFLRRRLQERVHLVICYSTVSEQFRTRTLRFPALLSSCVLVYFPRWSRDALLALTSEYLSPLHLVETTASNKTLLLELIADLHAAMTDVCSVYAAHCKRTVIFNCRTLITFIEAYAKLYTTRLAKLSEGHSRYENGLHILGEAERQVGLMKSELAEKEVQLTHAQEHVHALLQEIAVTTRIAETQKAEVLAEKVVLDRNAWQIEKEKMQAEFELAAAAPALEAAEQALLKLNQSDFSTLRKLAKPPALIKLILDTVLILRQLPIDKVAAEEVKGRLVVQASWAKSSKMISEYTFLSSLLDFRKGSLNNETIELLGPYLDMPDFTTEAATKVSGNIAGLCTWTRAMCTYFELAKVVEPKRVAVAIAEARQANALRLLHTAQMHLNEKEAALEKQRTRYDQAINRRQELEDEHARCGTKIDVANALVNGLASEKDRWEQNVVDLAQKITSLVGDAVPNALFLTYFGPFDQVFRERLHAQAYAMLGTSQIAHRRGVHIGDMLLDEGTKMDWSLQDLPTDDFSMQNAAIICNAQRYVLLIDPQAQAKAWLVKRTPPPGLKVSRFSDATFGSALEVCLSAGCGLMIESVRDVDSTYDNLLNKVYTRAGSLQMVVVGEREMAVHPDFALYLRTIDTDLSFSQELQSKVILIDFSVTLDGLEEQLLGRTIEIEMRALEDDRQALVRQVQLNVAASMELEEMLLNRLRSAGSELLNDPEIITVLKKTRQTAREIELQGASNREKQRDINAAREDYRQVAVRAAVMYSAISQMRQVSNMYLTSLADFDAQFQLAIRSAEPTRIKAKRVAAIVQTLTSNVFMYAERGYFESDRLLFALQLALSTQLRKGTVRLWELRIFTLGGATLTINTVRPKPADWLPDEVWLNLVVLGDTCGEWDQVIKAIETHAPAWKAWYSAAEPEKCPAPGFDLELGSWKLLLFIRCIRVDRTLVPPPACTGIRWLALACFIMLAHPSHSDTVSPAATYRRGCRGQWLLAALRRCACPSSCAPCSARHSASHGRWTWQRWPTRSTRAR